MMINLLYLPIIISKTNPAMPGIVHKIAIHPTVDGLILHPVAQRTQRIIPSLQIQYSTYEIISLASAPPSPPVLSTFLNVHGIIGTRPVDAIRKNALLKLLQDF